MPKKLRRVYYNNISIAWSAFHFESLYCYAVLMYVPMILFSKLYISTCLVAIPLGSGEGKRRNENCMLGKATLLTINVWRRQLELGQSDDLWHISLLTRVGHLTSLIQNTKSDPTVCIVWWDQIGKLPFLNRFWSE